MTILINGRTSEEIKRVLKWRVFRCGDIDCGDCSYGDICSHENKERSEPDALALIEHLEAKQPKWISVKEQGPVFPCLYWDGVNTPAVAKSLVAITLKDGKEVFVADALLEVFPEALQGLLEDCTHILYWMPLPEPPEEASP